jgi:serine/threonine protein kinase
VNPFGMILELLECSLFDVIHRRPTELSWEKSMNILTETAKGMVYLHNIKPDCILHRDLKRY